MEMHGTELLSAVTAPPNVTFMDDLEETVVASLQPPRVEDGARGDRDETELVGEDGEPIAEGEADAEGEGAEGESASDDGDSRAGVA